MPISISDAAAAAARSAGGPDAGDKAGRLATFIGEEAERLGFSAWGIARPEELGEAGARLREFVALGRHGTMGWLEDRLDQRVDPAALWQEVRSVIMLAMNYGPQTDPLENLGHLDRATISIYARHRDYHDLIKGRLKEMAGRLIARGGGDVKVFVDTAPVMEKPLAALAGLGWQGKHTNLVGREHGSWLFLGAIFTTLELSSTGAEADHCGSCRACLDICPTRAFPAPYQLDARRCISYLTIEHKDPIPRDLRPLMGNRIYGCDDCLAVCPWNKFARAAGEAKLKPRPDLEAPTLIEFLALDDAAFRARFSGSPIKRIGRDRFLRNVLIAAGNSGRETLLPKCKALLTDNSPLVRGAAVWAVSRLAGRQQLRALAAECGADPDAEVRMEWEQALSGENGRADA